MGINHIYKIRTIVLIWIYLQYQILLTMEGKQKFIYESPEKETAKNDTDIQDTISKILQVILGIIMAVLHM